MDKKVAATIRFLTLKEKTKFISKETGQLQFEVFNVDFEGQGIIKQYTKVFIRMDLLYFTALKGEYCIFSFENSICLVLPASSTSFSCRNVCTITSKAFCRDTTAFVGNDPQQ